MAAFQKCIEENSKVVENNSLLARADGSCLFHLILIETIWTNAARGRSIRPDKGFFAQ
jgi:hypothetical protein